MVLETIVNYWSQHFTIKLFLGMLIYRIADNIGFDIVPTWFPWFADIGANEERMPKIYKEIAWSLLIITILLIIAYMLRLKI